MIVLCCVSIRMLGVQADKTWMGPEMDGGIDNNKTTRSMRSCRMVYRDTLVYNFGTLTWVGG